MACSLQLAACGSYLKGRAGRQLHLLVLRVAAALAQVEQPHHLPPPPLQDLEDSEVQYWTGNADTATINTGVVFVIGSPDGGDGSSVGCLWFGDED